MKKLMIILLLGIVTSCGSSTENEEDTEKSVTPETIEKVKKAQDENTELEAIDGELDSLINSIN
jgi:PBP1b-binding outer membrane lipoprotein LpoB